MKFLVNGYVVRTKNREVLMNKIGHPICIRFPLRYFSGEDEYKTRSYEDIDSPDARRPRLK